MTSASPAARVFGATCPEHSGFKPVETCSRCGRFLCARCETWGEFCAACEHRRLREMPSSASRGRWTQRVLSLVALGASIQGALNGWLISRLHEGAVTTTAVGTYLRLSLLLNVLVVLATGLSALFFLRWLHLAVRTAKMLSLEPGTTPGWAVGWWFVPLANLYDPYLVVRGLWLCLGGSPKAGASVSTWWTAWVLSVVAWCVQVYLLATLAMDPFQLTSALLAGFVTGVLITLGALLCMRVIGQVQTLIDECMEEVAEAA